MASQLSSDEVFAFVTSVTLGSDGKTDRVRLNCRGLLYEANVAQGRHAIGAMVRVRLPADYIGLATVVE